MTPTLTLNQVYEKVAKSLVDFGYPDVQAAMIRDVHDAMKRGDTTMPHGIVGMFAKGQLDELPLDQIAQ